MLIVEYLLYELYLSSKKEKARSHAWVFEADEQNLWSARSCAPQKQRAEAPLRLVYVAKTKPHYYCGI